MRDPDCILVRVGEQALKSEQVQKKWMGILLDNIRATLQKKKIKFSFGLNPNRIFIYTTERRKVKLVLRKIFGITSFSECWKCHSGLDEIKLLAVDLAEHIKIGKRTSFAIRARRAGWHKFSSRTVAEEAGAAVKRVTNAPVNLSKPRKEIFIETRSRNTYMFIKKESGVGGVPLGTGGQVCTILKGRRDLLASWLIMRRGCTMNAVVKNKELLNKMKKWHLGKRVRILKNLKDCECKAIILAGEKNPKNIDDKMLFLRPLNGLLKKDRDTLTRIVG
jgi:tRNA uracil 4-sulfurtransferase